MRYDDNVAQLFVTEGVISLFSAFQNESSHHLKKQINAMERMLFQQSAIVFWEHSEQISVRIII